MYNLQRGMPMTPGSVAAAKQLHNAPQQQEFQQQLPPGKPNSAAAPPATSAATTAAAPSSNSAGGGQFAGYDNLGLADFDFDQFLNDSTDAAGGFRFNLFGSVGGDDTRGGGTLEKGEL